MILDPLELSESEELTDVMARRLGVPYGHPDALIAATRYRLMNSNNYTIAGLEACVDDLLAAMRALIPDADREANPKVREFVGELFKCVAGIPGVKALDLTPNDYADLTYEVSVVVLTDGTRVEIATREADPDPAEVNS